MDNSCRTYNGLAYTPFQPTTQQYIPTAPSSQVQTTMVIGAGMVPSPTTNYGPRSQNATCPYCHYIVHTSTRGKATSKTHLWACLLCCCLCCWIPYCMTSCMNINHYCPKCKTFLGTYYS